MENAFSPSDEACATGMLVRDGRLLLGKRAAHRRNYPGVWDLPGGHIEPGETPEWALVRELREEIGVTPVVWRALDVVHIPLTSTAPHDVLRLHIFLVTAWDGEPRNLLPDEHDAIAWLTPGEAAALPLAHGSYPALFQRALASI